MKLTKILGVIAAVAAMALMAFASTASATTLSIGGVPKNEAITIESSIKSSTSALLSDTFGALANTCTASKVEGKTASPFTGATVSGPISALSWSSCSQGNPTVDTMGSLSVEWKTATNGIVRSHNAKVTVPSPFGTLTCVTPNEGTDLGTLTGVANTSSHATMDINAVLSCGITTKWAGTYTVTSPTGLGVEK